MVTLKLSRWQEKKNDKLWLQTQVERVLSSGHAIQIIEDVPYQSGDNRAARKSWFIDQGVRVVQFKTILAREDPEKIVGNHKTFREFFAGKHPECDVRILGIAGEQSWMAVARMTQCMADYMDYIAERTVGR